MPLWCLFYASSHNLLKELSENVIIILMTAFKSELLRIKQANMYFCLHSRSVDKQIQCFLWCPMFRFVSFKKRPEIVEKCVNSLGYQTTAVMLKKTFLVRNGIETDCLMTLCINCLGHWKSFIPVRIPFCTMVVFMGIPEQETKLQKT